MVDGPLPSRPAAAETVPSAVLPDVLGADVRLLFVGINPGLRAAATGTPFGGRRGNRFYPALHRAGITGHLIDASRGLSADDVGHLTRRGIGITSLARRPTAGADEISTDELRDGLPALRRLVGVVEPRVVAVMGITAYRAAFGRPRAQVGRQPDDLEAAQLWVVPNPSGRNVRISIDDLAQAYAEVAAAAGVIDDHRRGPPA